MGYKQFLPLREFYNFGGFKICESFVTDKQVLVRLKRTWKTGICPSCWNKKHGTWVEKEYEREVRDLPILNRKVTSTIKNYLYGIVNYFKHGLTNAASEAFNNKIGLLKRIAYGYRDLEYFKLKIINCYRKSS